MSELSTRALFASVLFLLLTAGGVLAAGYGNEAVLTAGALPASFSTVTPHVGDRAVFVWDRVEVADDGSVRVMDEHEAVGFEWLPQTRAADVTGARHEALLLHQWGWQITSGSLGHEAPADWEPYADPAFAIGAHGTIYSYSYLGGLEPGAKPGEEEYHVQTSFATEATIVLPVCGGWLTIAGENIPLDRDVDLFRSCGGFPLSLGTNPHEPVRAVGTQRVGDHEALLLSARDGSLHVWLANDLPVPLRIAMPTCHDENVARIVTVHRCDEHVFDVLRLETFSRGSAPLPELDDAVTGNATSWRLAPLIGGLPDEAGTSHPFPASAALAAARNDPNATEFVRTLDNGYLVFVDYTESQSADTAIRTWALTAYDGTQPQSVRISRTDEPDGSTTIVTQEQGWTQGPWPAPDKAPREAPTVASMWQRWRAFAHEAYAPIEPTKWGMRIECLPTYNDACPMYAERWAGIERNVANPTSSGWVTSILRESDHPTRGHEMTLHEGWSLPRESGTPTSIQSAAAPGTLTTFDRIVWLPPANAAVAASILGATIVSLGYLLWPTLRIGIVALFSRQTTVEAALQHPVRFEIMEAIRLQPGLRISEISAKLGKSRSAIEHHLVILQRFRLVEIHQAAGQRRAFPSGSPVAWEAFESQSAVRRRVLEITRAQPELGPRQIARELGISAGTVTYHLKRARTK